MSDVVTSVEMFEKPELNNPTVICGLPGIGNVGKLVADYLAIELRAKLFCQIYSNTFPSQILINSKESELMKNDLYYTKDPDLVILCGNSQPVDCLGMYQVGEEIIAIGKELNVKTVITLAAYVSGYQGKKPRVFRAATDPEVIEQLGKLGVVKMHEGSISGLNGLLLGLCKLYDVNGICLLGETSGRELSDLKAARAVIKILNKMLNVDIDLGGIEQADQVKEDLIRETQTYKKPGGDDDEGYLIQYG